MCGLLVLLAGRSIAAKRAFYGRIITESGKGISMAAVESKDHRYHFQANTNGVFNFKAEVDSVDFFIFSGQGYESKDFLVEDLPDDSIIIELKKKKNVLPTAGVTAKGNKTKRATSGIDRGGMSTGCYLNIYDEIAIYLPAEKTKQGTLNEVGAFIGKGGVASNEFRFHVYARDTTTNAPGEEITDSIVMVHAKKGNEWVSADLTDKFIQIRGGVFVSVEWVIGERNEFLAFDIPNWRTNHYSGEDSLRQSFNGQVLGLDWQDHPAIVYRRYASHKFAHKDEEKWYLTLPLKGGRKGNSTIAPMIYYTYTYIDN